MSQVFSVDLPLKLWRPKMFPEQDLRQRLEFEPGTGQIDTGHRHSDPPRSPDLIHRGWQVAFCCHPFTSPTHNSF